MKVVVEGTPLYGEKTGVGQYVDALFSKVVERDTKNRYLFYVVGLRKHLSKHILTSASDAKYDVVPVRIPGRIWNYLEKKMLLPTLQRLLVRNMDVAVCTNFATAKTNKKTKIITFVYDVSFETHSQYSEKANIDHKRKVMKNTIERADIIVTISESSKRDIVAHYGIAADRVVVVYPGVDVRDVSASAGDRLKQELSVGVKPYILSVGTVEPRKNFESLVKAYLALPQKTRDTYDLVICGRKGWDTEAFYEQVKGAKGITLTGYVSDDERVALYKGAALFALVPYYEGFGMPPLEAMAYGVPVICSNNSSLPEVVGDAGVMVDAGDVAAITQHMIKILGDKDVAAQLQKKGYEQAAKFNWEASARQFVGILDSLDTPVGKR